MRTDLLTAFVRLFGSNLVRAPHDYEAAVAGVVVEPTSIDELGEVIRKCELDRMALVPLGACRTLRNLRTAPVAVGVSLSAMAKAISYDPDDMTIVTGAGMTLGALAAVLSAHGQYLPVDPAAPERTRIGAMLGAARGGPLRFSAGTVRDFLIGVQFAGHGGRGVRGGGRVVKNVAGYDLMKVMIGSFGTLGIITEATFKVRPQPEVQAAALGYYTGTRDAFDAAFRLQDALPLLYLELLSPGLPIPMSSAEQFLLAVGIGGNRRDADFQIAEIRKVIAGAVVLEGADAAAAYRAIRDLELPPAALTMQLSVAPRELPSCLISRDLRFRAHAGSGVAQVAFDGDDYAAMAGTLRKAAAGARGHATVLSIGSAMRAAVPIFDNPPAGALKLMRRLKAAFDPAGIFNPGCFVGGL